ncbi:MAG TPA: hypothetical protein VFQ67_16805 [Allosphingosinicella sp.]|jgi:hypothetical protein|nr:hypothetical protein [Allosphingosinicella sp.]
MSQTDFLAAVEALRTDLISAIDKACDGLRATFAGEAKPTDPVFKYPTLEDGHDPRNKNGLNLTPRGVEILYRVFDDGGGYNRAAKMLNISQGAAKNRKACWLRAGGLDRKKEVLDIDLAR